MAARGRGLIVRTRELANAQPETYGSREEVKNFQKCCDEETRLDNRRCGPPLRQRSVQSQCFLIPQTLENNLVLLPYLPSPEAYAGLRDLQTTNPELHAALSQMTETSPLRRHPTTVTVIIPIKLGEAEISDPEEESDAPVLGRDQRRKVVARESYPPSSLRYFAYFA
ncbi:hypothetical protein B0H19DRAFT_1082334 [Mycena capillaripes]|nr:hypothetical protein B0H19DRAFT_1082334 [Mycena capillaripes]